MWLAPLFDANHPMLRYAHKKIALHCAPKIWMACNDRTPKILNLKLRRVVIARGGISSYAGLLLLHLREKK